MPLSMARPLRPDAAARAANAAPSWAAEAAEAGPAAGPAALATAQMPLFRADDVAPARALQARLRSRIKALLVRRQGRPPERPAGSAWPDSFFDVDEKP